MKTGLIHRHRALFARAPVSLHHLRRCRIDQHPCLIRLFPRSSSPLPLPPYSLLLGRETVRAGLPWERDIPQSLNVRPM